MPSNVVCYRCNKVTPIESLSGFDVMSLPNGKEVVKQRFGIDNAKMYLVSLCSPCYEEAQAWTSANADGR